MSKMSQMGNDLQRYLNGFNYKIEEARRDLAAACIEGLKYLIRVGYNKPFIFGQKEKDSAPLYLIENGEILAGFPIGKEKKDRWKLIGFTTLEKVPISIEDIPFREFDISLLENIVIRLKKAIDEHN